MIWDKHNKSLTAKDWASAEGLSVREMECHMNVEMFLDGYVGWEVGSPHHPPTRCSNMPWSKGRKRQNV